MPPALLKDRIAHLEQVVKDLQYKLANKPEQSQKKPNNILTRRRVT